MTTFEYFKKQYDKNHDYMVECIRPSIPVDSFHFVEVAWKNCFGGTVDVDPWYNIKGVEDTKEMLEKGYLRKWDELGWYAQHAGTSRHVGLTKKGLKEFYKAMF